MNFVASFGINTIAAGIVYELNALFVAYIQSSLSTVQYKYGISVYTGKI